MRTRSFAWGLGILITALGAVAVIGPEQAQVSVTRVLGVLLILAGVLGLVTLANRPNRQASGGIAAWSLVALATGLAMEFLPMPGLSSLGSAIGLLLVGHGVTASSLGYLHWRARDIRAVGPLLAGSFLLLAGLALLFGGDVGVRGDELLLGLDVVLFGVYVMTGRRLFEPQSRSPSKASR